MPASRVCRRWSSCAAMNRPLGTTCTVTFGGIVLFGKLSFRSASVFAGGIPGIGCFVRLSNA